MKVAIMLLCCAALVSCASIDRGGGSNPEHYPLVGSWSGIDGTGKQGSFTFSPDGFVAIVIGGEMIGGANHTSLGALRYQLDASSRPMALDIIGYTPDGVEQGRMLMIIQFITPNRLKLRTNFNDVRPESFTGENVDDTLILDRVQ